MKEKKRLTIITAIFSLISFIIAIIAWVIGKSSNCIVYDISMAIFGSALLGMIMSLIEYFTERRKAMEKFWDEARKVLNELRGIRYINVDAPHDLIRACFSEEKSNEWREMFYRTQIHSARNDLILWLKENVEMSFTEEDDISAKIEDYRKEYQHAINSYIDAANIDIEQLSNAYGGLDFFFNKNIRSKVFSNIYRKIREFQNYILDKSSNFTCLQDGHDRVAMCADKASQICQFAFTEKYENATEKIEENNEINGFSGFLLKKSVYQDTLDEIQDSLEWFRCEIYRNEKYEATEKIPILVEIKSRSLEKKVV